MKLSIAVLAFVLSGQVFAQAGAPVAPDAQSLVQQVGSKWTSLGCADTEEECEQMAEEYNTWRASGEAESCPQYAYTCYGK